MDTKASDLLIIHVWSNNFVGDIISSNTSHDLFAIHLLMPLHSTKELELKLEGFEHIVTMDVSCTEQGMSNI